MRIPIFRSRVSVFVIAMFKRLIANNRKLFVIFLKVNILIKFPGYFSNVLGIGFFIVCFWKLLRVTPDQYALWFNSQGRVIKKF